MNKTTLRNTRKRAKTSGFVIRYGEANECGQNWFTCRQNGDIHGVPGQNRQACNQMWLQGELFEIGQVGNGVIYKVNA